MNVELLAPAGSWDAFEAALSAGADAVYAGGARFGARAYAENMDQEQMCRAIDKAHLLGKKLYMTVNTLLKERELEELYGYLLPFYREGLDGVIVQDFGAMALMKECFPGLPLHASTQMTVTGPEGALLLKEYGVKRVVPARELSLQEIRAIHDRTGMEVECFVHGALCYCYSGQCLMSSLIGGRSGNRGRCAQPCRLPWEVFEGGRRLNGRKTAYPLNTRDMCTVELLPEIIGAGVCSLKIEGRMKRPEYTAGVVGIYRKYLDLLETDPSGFRVGQEDLELLYGLFNRDGFNRSYYLQRNGRDMMALRNNREESSRQTETEKIYRTVRERWMNAGMQTGISGKLFLKAGLPAGLTVTAGGAAAKAEGAVVERAENRPVTRERVRSQLEKTGNSPFFFRNLEIEMEEGIFVPIQVLNTLRREGLEALKEEILARFRRKAPERPDRTEEEAETGRAMRTGKEETGGTAQELWASVETEEQFLSLKRAGGIAGLYLPAESCIRKTGDGKSGVRGDELRKLLRAFRELHSRGKKVRLALPHITRREDHPAYHALLDALKDTGLDGVLVRNLESAALLLERDMEDAVILDAGVYTFQNASREFWRALGVRRDTVPLELNAREISERNNRGSEMIVYGRSPMMISAQCLKKNLDRCTRSHAAPVLRDRKGAQFPVACCCNSCYNIIYNSVPTSLLADGESVKRTGCRSFRLSFTTEDGRETSLAAEQFAAVLLSGAETQESGQRVRGTRGHYRRGVE